MGVKDNLTAYDRAVEKVKAIKGFYSHLSVYIFINVLLQLFYSGVFDGGKITQHIPIWSRFTTPFFWGLCLVFHGLYVFKGFYLFSFYKRWEEREIKKIMQQQKSEQYKNNWK